MADPKRVEVELSDFLSDLEPVAMKGLVSAPIAYRADQLIGVLREGARRYGPIGPAELVSALLHGTPPDRGALATMIEEYREARVWETRHALGEKTPNQGSWEIVLRAPGQRGSG